MVSYKTFFNKNYEVSEREGLIYHKCKHCSNNVLTSINRFGYKWFLMIHLSEECEKATSRTKEMAASFIEVDEE